MKHELTPRRKERRIMAVWTSLVLTTALFTTSRSLLTAIR